MKDTSKSTNPRGRAGFLSILFFWWMNDLLKLGNKRSLTEHDLFPLLEDQKAESLVGKAEKCWLKESKLSQSKNKKPRLWKAVVAVIPWKSALTISLLQTFRALSFVFLPLCLWLLLKTLNDGPDLDMKFAVIYVVLLGAISTMQAVTTQHYDYLTELWGLKLKVALIGLVYKKVLSINRYSLENTSSGNTLNLVSNDAQKIEMSLNHMGMVLSAPLQLVVSMVILWYLIGWEALAGAGIFFCLVAFQILLARKAAELREKAATFTDERLVVMNEIISGIRAVKMYAWEWNFRDLARDLRRKEMSIIRLKGVIIAIVVVLFFTTLPIATLISVITLAFTGTQLSPFMVFTLLSGLMTIRITFCYNLSISLQIVADAKVALDRIQNFLEEQVSTCVESGQNRQQNNNQLLTDQTNIEDHQSKHTKRTKAVKLTKYKKRKNSCEENSHTFTSNSATTSTSVVFSTIFPDVPQEGPVGKTTTGSIAKLQGNASTSKEPYLSIAEVSCSWNQDHLPNTLTGITLNTMKGDMLAITGEVGSGKSSLLIAILGELPLREGKISYDGKVAYAPQIPWVFSGTIRENILFGLPFDDEKFHHVTDVCGLTRDLTDFAHGDLTEIGQRGATLSGGQKARVGLARAVYSDADIYLLDDPLSAVDTKVGRKLFESCIVGHLSGRIRFLVTHQLQHLKDLDHIAVMKDGSIIQEGGYTELKDKEIFSDVLEQQHADRSGRARTSSLYEFSEKGLIMEVINRPRSVTSVSVLKGRDFELPALQEDYIMPLPRIPLTVGGNYYPRRSRSISMFEFQETRLLERPSYNSNLFPNLHGDKGKHNLAFLNDPELPILQEEEIGRLSKMNIESTHIPQAPPAVEPREPVVDMTEEEESKMTGTVTWRLYWKYFKEGLPVPMIMLSAVVLVSAHVSLIIPNWWLARIAEMTQDQQKAADTHVIFASLVAMSIVFMTASCFLFYYLLLKASENLHNKMATATIKAPVLFFDTNPAGRILNRFSKDVGCMDDVLPSLFLQAVNFSLYCLCAVLVPAAANYWLFLALLPIIVIFGSYARYNLKSSRELKRIEAIKCSPLYSHITETLNGLEIIHTSNMNETFLNKLHRYQDENTQAFFMVVSCTRWLSIRLDLISSLFVTIVAVAAILVTENPALAGLALTYALQTLDCTQYSVRLSSEVENLMTSVERVMSYTKIDSETGYSIETRPPQSWPDKGSLAIKNLSLVYFKGGPCVLKDINFSASAKEKVGVVGRTGAGKSSLVSALFRMPEPLGKVFIDGVDLASIDLQEARRSMAVITQDPVLFGGSLRRNLDPFEKYTDKDLWTALEEVQLKTLVEDLPGQLEFELKESGTNLSVGERQLVCLARALVQKSKIIVMDEATANVDFKTDRLIQEVIRHRFRDSTVLTIAHRLNTIMDYDKVLVLDGGRVAEFDKPEVLIRNGGLFAEMVESQNQTKH